MNSGVSVKRFSCGTQIHNIVPPDGAAESTARDDLAVSKLACCWRSDTKQGLEASASSRRIVAQEGVRCAIYDPWHYHTAIDHASTVIGCSAEGDGSTGNRLRRDALIG